MCKNVIPYSVWHKKQKERSESYPIYEELGFTREILDRANEKWSNDEFKSPMDCIVICPECGHKCVYVPNEESFICEECGHIAPLQLFKDDGMFPDF